MRLNSAEDRLEVERKNVEGIIQNESLLEYFRKILSLSAMDDLPALKLAPTTKWTFLYITPKKQYEITHLAPYIAQFASDHQIERMIDIGGGIGLLSQTVNSLYGTPITSVDMDLKLQETGKIRQAKNTALSENLVEYQCVKVDTSEVRFRKLLGPTRATMGLHTCGGLAVSQIVSSVEENCKGMINFGCCYNKLLPNEQNISQFAKKNGGLVFNQYALTLSARAHKKFSFEDIELKWKVKHFRFTFHFMMCDFYDQWRILNLGNSPKKLYDMSFADYALEHLKKIGIESKLSFNELNAYYERPENLKLIQQMMCAALIRDGISRLLEFYILLDRCLYLEENGYKTELLSFFKEEVSPRNLGIVALRST